MKKLYASLIILFINVSGSIAQPNSVHSESQTFKYNSNTGSTQAHVNKLLQTYSQRSKKSVHTLSYKIDYTIRTEIDRVNDSTVELSGNLESLSMSGITEYRSFGIRRYLLPDVVSISLQVIGKNGAVISDVVYDDVDLTALLRNKPSLLAGAKISYSSESGGVRSVKVMSVTYGFNSGAHDFSNHLNNIDQYYKYSHSIVGLIANLRTVDHTNGYHIYDEEAKMIELGNALAEIENSAALRDLNIDRNDPARLKPKLIQARRQYQIVHANVEDAIANLHFFYYDEGIRMLSFRKTGEARKLFETSLEIHPGFAPAQLQIAYIDYDNGYVDYARDLVLEIIRSDADYQTKQSARELGKNIAYTYLEQGEDLLAKDRFQDAIEAANKADDISQRIGSSSIARSDQIRKAGYNGMYEQHLLETEKALKINDVFRARTSVEKALTLQRSASAYIPDASLALRLKEDVDQMEYEFYISKGNSEMEAGSYVAALSSYEKALTFDKYTHIEKSPDLRSAATEAAKGSIYTWGRNVEELAASNRLREANKQMNRMIETNNRYSLSSNQEIAEIISAAQQAIKTQECINAKNEFDAFIEAGDRAARAKDFVRAEREYQNAIAKAKDASDCFIEVSIAEEKLASVVRPAEYQQMISSVERLILRNDYQEAIQKYNDAGGFFEGNLLSEYGLNHKDLFNFILAHKREKFLLYGVKYYNGSRELDRSLALVKELSSRKFNRTRMKNEQLQLGALLAQRDRANGVGGRWKNNVAKYIGVDKNLKFIKKGYKKGWKQ